MKDILLGDLVEYVTEGIIIHQVNAQSVMGSGIAKSLKDKYPKVWSIYKEAVPFASKSHLGTFSIGEIAPKLFIANIVGQEFYGRDKKRYTSYDALDNAFSKLKIYISLNFEKDIPIHLPYYLGSGLGGGNVDVIQAIISDHMKDFNMHYWDLPKSD